MGSTAAPEPPLEGELAALSIGGQSVPFFVIPFAKNGMLRAPITADRMRAAIAGGITDVVVVSHGWNTDWARALDFYRRFVAALDQVVQVGGGRWPARTTMVVGVSWPSIALPATPVPALAGPAPDDPAAVAALAEELVGPAGRSELHGLLQAAELDRPSADRLAELFAPLYGRADDELPGQAGPADDLVATWAEVEPRLDEAAGPLVISGPSGWPGARRRRHPTAGPAAAGRSPRLNPRYIVRMATVLMMKDRAGVVGQHGVGPLLAGLLDVEPALRVHLVGHSYGCKVMLAAACAPDLPRRVRSALLLQPAVSYLALADDVPSLGGPGGYHAAKARAELPIMVTWSDRDVALHDIFSLAVRRRADLGERGTAAAGLRMPPTPFAAMGGWGPAPAPDVADLRIRRPGDGAYALDSAARVLALDGSRLIGAHNDVVQDATAWALYNLMTQD